MKHTPEPWWDESGTAHAKAAHWTPEHHACVHPIYAGNGTSDDVYRACECVNACAGINPAAVPKMVEALRELLHHFCGGGERRMSDAEVMEMARAALALAENTEE